jgi:2-iminobutanoate/2-iminopropanoate deaminase
MTNTRVISTERAPKAIGPYSQAVAVPMGELLFCSGQIPLDPATGQLIAGGIDEQTTRVLDNIAAVLDEAGCGFGDVVKTTIFLADLSDFARVNELYAARFAGQTALPARSTVQVARLPRDSRVEIEVIAAKR